MPVVTLPLCSLDAVGTIARRHTFYPKAGKTILRQRVIPANPSSQDQVTARAVHSLCTHLIRWAVATTMASDGQPLTDKQRLQAITPMARRWVNLIYSKALQDSQANVRGALLQWSLMAPADAAAWDAAAAALSPAITAWTPATAPGAPPPSFAAGELFFTWRYLLFLLRVVDTAPDNTPPTYLT